MGNCARGRVFTNRPDLGLLAEEEMMLYICNQYDEKKCPSGCLHAEPHVTFTIAGSLRCSDQDEYCDTRDSMCRCEPAQIYRNVGMFAGKILDCKCGGFGVYKLDGGVHEISCSKCCGYHSGYAPTAPPIVNQWNRIQRALSEED